MRELIQDLPAEDQRTKKTKNEHPSRNRSKIVSHKKGDDLKRRKTNVSSDEEGTSNEDQDSSDDEEWRATFPTKKHGVPRGRHVRGLVELQTRLPEYKGFVSYRAYRFEDIEAVIDENDTSRVNGILKRVKHHFSYSFGGEVPLKVLDFLSTVKEAMDLNHISEGAIAIVLPYLIAGEAKDAWLLEPYATDAAIDAVVNKFLTAKKNPGKGEDVFASRLRRYATEAGNVYKEDALVSRYLAGLPLYTAITIRVQVSPRMRFTQVNNLAVQVGFAGMESWVSNQGFSLPTIPGLLTRPRGVVATLAGSPSTSASTHETHFDMMYEALVAAAEYEQCEGNTSMMSGPSSDVSFSSRGWASVAASVQGDPDSAVMERARGFHVCFRRDHFLMD
jgi:hypothetical protein